ncbi:MAG: lytic transglycosylase domain-containing protein [Pararhodobacter sp.]|nr:lytic transglycosylase domain-containing protein [Pararhodobacter sp.]
MTSSTLDRFAATGAALAALIFSGGVAHGSGEDFTFRRVVVAPSDGPRITVQIDPEEQARRLAPRQPATPSPPADTQPRAPDGTPPSARHGWFWARVVPDIDAGDGGGAGRYLRAMEVLATPPEGEPPVPQPRLNQLQSIATQHGPAILRASIGTRVSPALALAVISVESAGRADAVSRAGAEGLMQLIPATAERFGVSDSFNAAENIRGGIAYLDWLLGNFGGDVVLALAGYNAGEGAVRRAGGVPAYAETRDYVPRVLAAWEVARGLCVTRPELPSDGCVFAVGASARADEGRPEPDGG